MAFRVARWSRLRASRLVESIRSYKLLTGVRGQGRPTFSRVVDSILRVGELVGRFPEIAELDINPLSCAGEGNAAVAV